MNLQPADKLAQEHEPTLRWFDSADVNVRPAQSSRPGDACAMAGNILSATSIPLLAHAWAGGING